jgi:hypothetical protein
MEKAGMNTIDIRAVKEAQIELFSKSFHLFFCCIPVFSAGVCPFNA